MLKRINEAEAQVVLCLDSKVTRSKRNAVTRIVLQRVSPWLKEMSAAN